ncbi:unnamed protein product [Musa textilis]
MDLTCAATTHTAHRQESSVHSCSYELRCDQNKPVLRRSMRGDAGGLARPLRHRPGARPQAYGAVASRVQARQGAGQGHQGSTAEGAGEVLPLRGEVCGRSRRQRRGSCRLHWRGRLVRRGQDGLQLGGREVPRIPAHDPEDELLPKPSPELNPSTTPLMMQVTEFAGGGFVVGLIFVHAIADGLGIAQFLNAVAEIARGLPNPTVEPAWSREVIPNPPKLPPGGPPVFPSFKLLDATVDLSADHINHVKARHLELTGQRCSIFDVAISNLWQSRTRAINLDPGVDVHVCFVANTRHLLRQVLVPEGGYYGNCIYPVTATASSGRIASAELIDVISIIRDAKARLPDEFAKWAAGEFKVDPYELSFTYNTLFVTDWTRLGFLDVDYGWGKPLHVIPFSCFDIITIGIIGAPPAPQKGTRVMTHCVEKEHMQAFLEEMKGLA